MKLRNFITWLLIFLLAVAIVLATIANFKLSVAEATILDLTVSEARLTDELESQKTANNELARIMAIRQAATLEAETRQTALLSELRGLEAHIKNYKPEVATNASACLDLSPPNELTERLQF